MIPGSFLGNLPTLRVPVEFNGAVSNPDFIIDTGFSGCLKVDSATAKELGIEEDKLDVVHVRNANGQKVPAGLAHGFAELESKKRAVEILVADGPYLLGINFIATFNYKAIIDCKNWECRLESA
jgi:predicted aspartyl protease